MSQWPNLEDNLTGVLGLTQLPVSKPYLPGKIELHQELDQEFLCWSNAYTPEPVEQTEIRVFPGANTDTPTAKQVAVYDPVDELVEIDFTGALDRFVRLKTGKDVLRFSRRYGVLDFCQHGLPATHNPRFLSIPLLGLVQSTNLWKPIETGIHSSPGFMIEDQGERQWCEPIRSEAIEGWLFWSRMAAALLNVAASMTRGQSTSRDDWDVIITEESDEIPRLIDSLLARGWAARIYLQEAVNRWLHLANVRLSLSWPIEDEKASLTLEADTFGLLGIQLLAALTGAQALAVCDGCDSPYIRPNRRPQTGRANYCPECKAAKVPERLRQQRKRARMRQSKSKR